MGERAQITLVKGDITRMEVDAIVNAANRKLQFPVCGVHDRVDLHPGDVALYKGDLRALSHCSEVAHTDQRSCAECGVVDQLDEFACHHFRVLQDPEMVAGKLIELIHDPAFGATPLIGMRDL